MKTQPKISISTAFSDDLAIEEQIALIADAGFSHISLGSNPEHSGYLDPARRRKLKDTLSRHDLKIDTIHARNLARPDAISEATATVRAASDLGVKCIVAHISPFELESEYSDNQLRELLNICNNLVPVARQNGIVLAIENLMPGAPTELVKKALSQLDRSMFGLCYDSAHDQIDGPRPFDLIDEFRGRISAVHLSDRIKPFVDHVIPGEGFIDWPAMCDKLRLARYTGPVLMEVMMLHSRYQEPKTFLDAAYKAAIKTYDLINEITDK